mgnify:FL=1
MEFKKSKNSKMVKEIRNNSFRKYIPLNQKLLNIINDIDKDYFLSKNPAGQNIYLYLCEYVKNFSEWYFKKSPQNLKVLDWGCGKGQVTFLLKEMNFNVISCDLNKKTNDSAFGQIAPIIEKANIKIIPLEHEYLLPFSNECFDIVLSFGVLEHVSNDQESLKEINRVLKPEGLFFCFNLPYFLSWTQRLAHFKGDFYHNRLYNKNKVINLLNKSNFYLIDLWHRQLFPKNNIKYSKYRVFETIDQFLVAHTFLKYFATSIEFVAYKK